LEMNVFSTLKLCAFSCLFLCGTVTANSQSPTCTGTTACETIIDENFNGGVGTFDVGASTFTGTGGKLVSGNRGGQNPKVFSPFYSSIYTAGAVGSVLTYRFTIESNNQNGAVTSYTISAKYGPGANDVIVLCSGTTLSGTPCFNYTVDPILAGKRFQFQFAFSITGTGNQARISFDDFATNVAQSESQIPLPVNFISFNGKKTSKGTELTWKVGGEVNVKAYEVERSTNGNSQFTKIGSVPATGSDSYTFTDAAAHSGVVFYRVRNIDEDGKFKYSTVISFNNGAASTVFKVVPTVVTYKTTVQHGASGGNASITLSTADGRVVRNLRPAAGAVQTDVDMSNLNAGLYILKWSNGNGAVETVKVVKQ